jgi:T6SS immunity protein Tdi1, C-terminal
VPERAVSDLQDYTIPHEGFDWTDLLASWAWILPPRLTVWIMNRFGDLLLVLPDRSVHMLDTGRGSFEKVGVDRDDFARKADEDDNIADWFMMGLVDGLVATGITLGDGQCYSYKHLPVLGGDYSLDNTKVVTIEHHFKAFGPIHEKLRALPDGTEVIFEVEG